MAGQKPGDHEDDESKVAKFEEGEVAEHLGELSMHKKELAEEHNEMEMYMVTDREVDVRSVHDQHDETPHTREVIKVRGNHKSDGDDMVGHHLPVVFPSCFSIQDEELMHVERGLSEVINFDGSSER